MFISIQQIFVNSVVQNSKSSKMVQLASQVRVWYFSCKSRKIACIFTVQKSSGILSPKLLPRCVNAFVPCTEKQICYVAEFSSWKVWWDHLAFRSHLQVATTATFCSCNMSFDFQPYCSIFGQKSSFEFHLQLFGQQQQAKISLGTIWLQCRGYCFKRNKTIFNVRMFDQDFPLLVGQLWLNRLTETSKQCTVTVQCDHFFNMSCKPYC